MRIVFFGVHGAFSTVPLRALSHAGHRPELVVLGLERQPGQHPPSTKRTRPGGNKWSLSKWFEGENGGPQEDLEKLAHELGIDVVRTANAADAVARGHIHGAEPDVFVVAGFPHLLSQSVLHLAKRGGLNIHPGALPAERGAAPLFWALKEGRRELTWTIHMLDEGEDTGDIVRQGQVHITAGEHGQAILRTLAEAAAVELLRSVRDLFAGDLVRMPQSKKGIGRKRRPGFADGKIDPSRSAEEVFTYVAACAGSYSVWAECAEDRFFVAEAISYDMDVVNAPEWSLFADRLLLSCNPGVVELKLKDVGVLFAAEYQEDSEAS